MSRYGPSAADFEEMRAVTVVALMGSTPGALKTFVTHTFVPSIP